MELLFAAGFGFLLGAGLGQLRAARRQAARRAAAGAASGLARFLPAAAPTRSAADILAGRIRILLGGALYELPVLPRAASRRWLEALDERWAQLPGLLDAAGNDTPAILRLLVAQTDAMYEALYEYDQSGALPERAVLEEVATDAEVLRAVMEVWLAANPLAATLADVGAATDGTSPELPSSPPSPTAGVPMTSSTG